MENPVIAPEVANKIKEKLLKTNAELLEKPKPSDCMLFTDEERAKEGILESDP
jgi:hypothetical protein